MRQRLRTNEEIKKAVLTNFKREFPGESTEGVVFSTYILDVYCRSVENYELCRQTLMRGVDIDL